KSKSRSIRSCRSHWLISAAMSSSLVIFQLPVAGCQSGNASGESLVAGWAKGISTQGAFLLNWQLATPRSGSPSDRGPHQVAPFGPGAVIILAVRVAEQIGQHEPGEAGTLADAAVGDDRVVRLEADLLLVDGAELLGGLEGPVLLDGSAPGDVLGARDMPAAEGALLGVILH